MGARTTPARVHGLHRPQTRESVLQGMMRRAAEALERKSVADGDQAEA
jgi:hypothetical protein